MAKCGFELISNQWESEFFGQRIAKLQFLPAQTALSPEFNKPEFNQESAVWHDFDLVQCKLHADQLSQIHQLQSLGFEFVEGELDFCLSLNQGMQSDSGFSIAAIGDIEQLEAIFGSAFLSSRFRQPWFSAEQNSRFYRTWIRKAVLAQFDDLCLLLKNQHNEIQGAISLRAIDSTQARVGLLAVAEHARGRGIAKQLLQSAVNWCLQQQKQQLWIATQANNRQAINLYQKQARLEQISYWFYHSKKRL
ncbi:dTDP-4-amino-4,6-dideoxy-D-galactose acyltransferase [Pasteurellaceae bacterium USgator11]|nr:dTDP-4-amino-4,6-dideoxy-D-galactose acyltransferase [Pasteurellaceae bacterium USgator41]TNG94162.1 dTDP-4-amino-4,6-dideoxy-D-galactose acyltransferase [Pasteurellaceae bacterium UScroc12]TNG99694.1 dTDP-4-amino-4,6-dideoxy-D-galactose acyltransferase [Pasteurellaceae bacterium UScroc31]TNH01299.1 dTDP-4-amino-4,6-dideoxy-D-galactose acyltransferase [Pasteurellaceae bacterium USgator11]